jgi:hypothetical protein
MHTFVTSAPAIYNPLVNFLHYLYTLSLERGAACTGPQATPTVVYGGNALQAFLLVLSAPARFWLAVGL